MNMGSIWIIDRFEGDYAIIEDGESILKLSVRIYPRCKKKAMCLHFDGKYIIDLVQNTKTGKK